MSIGWKKSETVVSAESADPREATVQCDSCRSESGPFTHFRHRGDYCSQCTPAVYGATRWNSGGRRIDDQQFPSGHRSPSPQQTVSWDRLQATIARGIARIVTTADEPAAPSEHETIASDSDKSDQNVLGPGTDRHLGIRSG